uniref:Uncharacterized protein n=1 Tax=Panagrolaimus sp. PS1159 TaxID=55785 RepID=A0AC35F602_9BILA
MSYKFLMDFLVDKQFLFSSSEMCKVLVKSQRYCSAEDEDLFKTVYEIVENQALQKQAASSDIDFNLNEAIKTLQKQAASSDINFNLNEAIKSEMTDFYFNYYNMSFEFVLEYIADDDFNLENAIKDELRGVLPRIRFSQMSLEYINEKIVGKKFLFSSSELYKYLLYSKRTREQEEEFFKAVYELAEEYALKKQETILSENFDLKAAVKEELNGIIPKIKFSSMKLDFLVDFVVKKGFTFNAAELYKLFVDFKDKFENEELLLE